MGSTASVSEEAFVQAGQLMSMDLWLWLLLLLDRGFWSYGLFWQIQWREAFFGIRLRTGVLLKTSKSLGPDDRLVE